MIENFLQQSSKPCCFIRCWLTIWYSDITTKIFAINHGNDLQLKAAVGINWWLKKSLEVNLNSPKLWFSWVLNNIIKNYFFSLAPQYLIAIGILIIEIQFLYQLNFFKTNFYWRFVESGSENEAYFKKLWNEIRITVG